MAKAQVQTKVKVKSQYHYSKEQDSHMKQIKELDSVCSKKNLSKSRDMTFLSYQTGVTLVSQRVKSSA